MIIAKSQFFSVPFDRKYIIRREICNFPPQKSKFLPQNHRKKFENWKLKIHVKFCGVFCFGCFGIPLHIILKGKGLNYPQVYSHWSSPFEVPQLIGRDVTLSFVPIGPKNDVHQKSKAKSPSITGSSETPLKKSGVALEFWCTSFFGPIGRRRLWNTRLWLVPPYPRPF